ncbi:MAG: hypothetical protein EBR73_17270 [Rhodobacteraceae bacterium]|nr:hypothetical protein [Paracoccaceae bacterium]
MGRGRMPRATLTGKVFNMTKTTQANKPADMLIAGGRAAFNAGEGVAAANKARASALDMLVAGLTSDMLKKAIAFDICDRAGNVVESAKASLADYARGFKNDDGSDNRTKQGAFRSTVLPALFGVPGDQSAGAKAAWALVTGKALPAASALAREGMTAKLVDDKLVVEGGAGDNADKLREAAGKSTSALVNATKPAKGTNRETPQNDDGRIATPSEITRAAVALAKLIAKGDATACEATMSNLRAIAALVASNPDAFADD